MYKLPQDLAVPRYALPELLGNAEAEEVAARLVHESGKLGGWYPVPLEQFMKTAQAEYELGRAAVNSRHALREWELASAEFERNNAWSMGLWGKIFSAPTKPEAVPEQEVPFSGVHCFGPGFLVQGLKLLIDKELVTLVDSRIKLSDELIHLISDAVSPK